MLSTLGYVGIALMALSFVLYLAGRESEAKKVRRLARGVSWMRRAIRTGRVVMAFVSGLGGFGMTGYDLVDGCGENESLRSPAAVVQLVSNDVVLAEEDPEDGEEEDGPDDREDDDCDD